MRLSMVISFDFRMGRHRDDDHEKDAFYFTLMKNHENLKFLKKTSGKLKLPGFPEKKLVILKIQVNREIYTCDIHQFHRVENTAISRMCCFSQSESF